MLYTAEGIPAPPQDIVQRLKTVDERLDLVFMASLTPTPWAVTMRWLRNDPRREMIQQGKMNPEDDFDIIAYLPEDCSVQEAFGYVTTKMVRLRNRHDVGRMLDRLHKANAQAQQDAFKETTELAEDLVETNAGTLFRNEGKTVPKVYQYRKRER